MGIKTDKFNVRTVQGQTRSFQRTGIGFAEMTPGYDYSVIMGGWINVSTSSVVADRFDHTAELSATLVSANLTTARAFPGMLTDGKGVGYVCAGATAGSSTPTNTVDKVLFSVNVTAAAATNIGRSPAQQSCKGYTGNWGSKGYLFSGTANNSTSYNICTTVDYATEIATSGPVSMQQSLARYGYGVVSSDTVAVSAGGWTGSVSTAVADKHILETEVGAAQTSANLTIGGNYPSAGGHSTTIGYFLGRYNSGQYNTADKLTFSTLITSAMSTTLWVSGNGVNMGSSATNAYGFGGYTGSTISTIGRLSFSTELAAVLPSTLSVSRGYAGSMSGVTW